MKHLPKYKYPVVIDEWLKNETRKLDEVLHAVITHSYGMPDITYIQLYNELNAKKCDTSQLEMALEKLLADKMIKVTSYLMPPQNIGGLAKDYLDHYMVTFEGKLRALSGGYIGQIERDNKEKEQIENIRISQKRLTKGALIIASVAATISLLNFIYPNFIKNTPVIPVTPSIERHTLLKAIPEQLNILNSNLYKIDSSLRNLRDTAEKFY